MLNVWNDKVCIFLRKFSWIETNWNWGELRPHGINVLSKMMKQALIFVQLCPDFTVHILRIADIDLARRCGILISTDEDERPLNTW